MNRLKNSGFNHTYFKL